MKKWMKLHLTASLKNWVPKAFSMLLSMEVYRLKEKVLEKNKNHFQNVDAINLKIWSVRVSRDNPQIDEIKGEYESVETILAGNVVKSASIIKECFKNINTLDLHFVVQGEPNKCTMCGKEIEDIHELTLHIHLEHENLKKKDDIFSSHFVPDNEVFEETVLVKKPIYRSKFEFDRKEGNNNFYNPGENADSDD
ncbi:hypothetical protein Glove_26g324 [Diversispora epigaea]|uniref:C2H2-type domain-containing protein n=1 Tax=Diversispora epigaea TaxID=1348612 RepID=A0A397JLI0_9GLOM|nr:hypothetical protein Glove_26g324 [Diversispora epigaea]